MSSSNKDFIESISGDFRQEFYSHVEDRYILIPNNLNYLGRIKSNQKVFPPSTQNVLKKWMYEKGQEYLYYLLTEYSSGDSINFRIHRRDLINAPLSEVNPGMMRAGLLTVKDLSFVLDVFHDGFIHYGGPEELFCKLVGLDLFDRGIPVGTHNQDGSKISVGLTRPYAKKCYEAKTGTGQARYFRDRVTNNIKGCTTSDHHVLYRGRIRPIKGQHQFYAGKYTSTVEFTNQSNERIMVFVVDEPTEPR